MANTKIMDLRDLLVSKISALYDIEQELVKALPKLAKAATNPDLKDGFREHLDETRTHVERLERVFKILDEKPKKLKSEGIRGISADAEWVIKNVKPESALDANLARAAQYAEHYEMAGYMGAIAWADELGENEIKELLEETLSEEIAADQKLSEAGEMLQQEVI